MLPRITAEFGVVMEPDVQFSKQGKCWMKLRCIAKDRKKDDSGKFMDGDPLFIDVLVFGKHAEHLAESVKKGDSVTVSGQLSPNKWTDKEGGEHNDIRVIVDWDGFIGMSVAWNPAKSPAMLADSSTGIQAAISGLGASEVTDSDAPF